MSSTAPWRTVRCGTLRTRCCRCIPGKIRIASRCAAPAPVGEDVDTPDDVAPPKDRREFAMPPPPPPSPEPAATPPEPGRHPAPKDVESRTRVDHDGRWSSERVHRPADYSATIGRDTRTIGADQAAATPASASASAAFPPPLSRHPRRRKGGRPSSTAAASSPPPRPARPTGSDSGEMLVGILRGLRSGNDRISDPPPVKIPYNIRPFESESIPPSLRDNNIGGLGVGGWGGGCQDDCRLFFHLPSVPPPPPRRSGTPPGTPGASEGSPPAKNGRAVDKGGGGGAWPTARRHRPTAIP